jgi:hypothetical protein
MKLLLPLLLEMKTTYLEYDFSVLDVSNAFGGIPRITAISMNTVLQKVSQSGTGAA